jgi:hypothetical protein
MGWKTWAWLALSVCGLLGVTSGCSSAPSCGPGAVERDGRCVAELACGEGTVAYEGLCVTPDYVCVPDCEGNTCGDDGCGGSCGECAEGAPFCVEGNCVVECTPECEGRACGPDGCGGSCGECAEGSQCADDRGACVPLEWTCAPDLYGDGGACDCACGLPDPDCDAPEAPVRGCARLGATCSAEAECEGGYDPADWTCAPGDLGSGSACDCGCGIPDPDCADTSLPVAGCGAFEACGEDGTCQACAPDCAGKECGTDGCGGTCGECDEPGLPFCDDDGVCVGQCEPDCEGKTCGPDGCGNFCGEVCDDGLACVDGACGPLPAALSCEGLCGQTNPESGCSCADDCMARGTCCGDAERLCGCQPMCDGRLCGPDGCGGTCGACANGFACSEDGAACVDDPCDPNPCANGGACQAEGGECLCPTGYGGAFCDECAPGFVGYPSCVPAACNPFTCNANGTCDPVDGSCACFDGFDGATCDMCAPGKGTYPNCMP